MKDLKRLNAHMQNGEIEYVMCAANYHDDGKDHDFQPFNIDKGFVISGWRHGCVGSTFLAIARNFSGDENIPARWDDCEQGFLTTKNRFLSRKEALVLVRETGQLKGDLIGGMLTSEDLW